MTMTETKLSDEEIQGLIELNVFERERCDSRKIPLFDDNVAALRQLQADNQRLVAENEMLKNRCGQLSGGFQVVDD